MCFYPISTIEMDASLGNATVLMPISLRKQFGYELGDQANLQLITVTKEPPPIITIAIELIKIIPVKHLSIHYEHFINYFKNYFAD